LFCGFYGFDEVDVGQVEAQLREQDVTDAWENVALKGVEHLSEGTH
jgi:hypothetical protein